MQSPVAHALINHACVMKPWKTPKDRAGRVSFQVGEGGGGVERRVMGWSLEALSVFSHTPYPIHLVHLAVSELYPFITYLSSGSHSRKLVEPKEGVL